jgi:glycine dehydrogenase subunit 1
MPFIPHTEEDIQHMLATVGVKSIDDLFDEIPAILRKNFLQAIPDALSEMAVTRLMHERAQQDVVPLSFIGAGAYEHHIPAAIFDILSRGEFLTAYTPYQAEASQGNLQLIYEYQTMMASLTGMQVSNASLYDGASALAEAVLMAIRASRKKTTVKKVLIPSSVNPDYRLTVTSLVQPQGIEIIEVPFSQESGHTLVEKLSEDLQNITALVIPQPNFFGVLEDVDQLTNWAHQHNILVIALVNPTSLALLKAPGQWGQRGADIVCGEGQPLGVPLSSGGPYFGFLTCKQEFVRQMPGRIVGRTVDMDGKPGFTLTLQAREQHIRRSKATSNICTNQGLLVTAATIYMCLLGAEGLRRVAVNSHQNAITLMQKLKAISGVELVFKQTIFHEFVVRVTKPVQTVLEELAEAGIQGGYALESAYPYLKNCLLICTTETKTEQDLQQYAEKLQHVLENKKIT